MWPIPGLLRNDRQQEIRFVPASGVQCDTTAKTICWAIVGIGMGHPTRSPGAIVKLLAEFGEFALILIVLAANGKRNLPANRNDDATRHDFHVALIDLTGR